jgi:6-phosphofructokinase 1
MSKFKILIAENNKLHLQSYSDSLRRDGYEIVGAGAEGDAEGEALRILRENFIHLAVIDVRLIDDDEENDKTGLELCERLDPLTPRIVLTGYIDDWTTIRDALMPAPGGRRERLADGFFYKGAKSRVTDREGLYTEIKKVLSAHYEIIPEKRFAILTSGGDAPGMNAAIHAVVRSAMANGVEVLGVEDGYEGLIHGRIHKLRWNSVSEAVMESGTMLRSARCKEFLDRDVRGRAVENILSKHVSGLIVIGGDGSMNGARVLAEEVGERRHPFQIIGIPGTIDNDIYGTDMSLGAASAANAMIDQIRQIIPPAKALGMIFVIEVMGAYSGFLALESAIGTGADAVVIPEELVALAPGGDPGGRGWKERIDLPRTRSNLDAHLEKVALRLRRAFEIGKRYGLVIQAEGLDKCTRESVESAADSDSAAEFMTAEYTRNYLARRFKEWYGEQRHPVRVQRLGYAVRGVPPSRFDVWLGAASGKRAVELLLQGKTDLMVKWSESEGITEIPISEAVDKSGRAPEDIWEERESWRRIAELQQVLARPLDPLSIEVPPEEDVY